MSTKGLKTKHPNRGSALWVLVLLILMVAGLFLWTNVRATGPGSGMTQEESTGQPQGQQTPTAELATLQEGGITPSGRVEAGPLPYRKMKRVFDGQGEISGELFPGDGIPMPEKWTLVIEPSKFALGRETAVGRELEFSGLQTTFEVRDLPMGSYRVFARGEGQASSALEVSLFRIEGSGNRIKDHSRVMLRMQALSNFHVSLQNEDFLPAMDLPLILESKNTRMRWEGITDAVGDHTFRDLPTGAFTLMVGFENQPLLPPATVQIETGKDASWKGTIPATYEVTLRVIDGEINPLPGATVRGHGGAPIDGITDYTGEITLRYLPKGTYRLRIEHKDTDRHGRATIQIPSPDGQPSPLLVYCR